MVIMARILNPDVDIPDALVIKFPDENKVEGFRLGSTS